MIETWHDGQRGRVVPYNCTQLEVRSASSGGGWLACGGVLTHAEAAGDDQRRDTSG